MKTTIGIPCNDYIYTPGSKRDRITFRFVTDDERTHRPLTCTIRLGDTDPMTGETITDVAFFREYYKEADHQIYTNRKAARTELTEREKEQYESDKAEFAADFEKKYGYQPSYSDIREGLAKRWPKAYHQSIQEMINDEGDDKSDRRMDLSIPAQDPFDTDVPDDIACLREVASSLTGRLADVYIAMLAKFDEGTENIPLISIAEKWSVSPAQITYDQEKIRRMIRKAIEAARNEQY